MRPAGRHVPGQGGVAPADRILAGSIPAVLPFIFATGVVNMKARNLARLGRMLDFARKRGSAWMVAAVELELSALCEALEMIERCESE